ncbi:MAG: histidine kinase [Eubacteriales bacterium]|nr:histidine kinase [Eubacteriales bacterium]
MRSIIYAEDTCISDNNLKKLLDNTGRWSKTNRELIEKYRELTERKDLMELALESSKYIALQRQINPHFLYNALEGIRCELMLANQMETAGMVESLSNYFSYSISALDELGTMEEEIQNVEDFFEIEKFRFGDRVNLEKKIELEKDQLQSVMIPRMTLQPLVENAIQHGLENKEDSGIVTLHVYKTENHVICKIMDNGNGMSEEQLRKINESLDGIHFERASRKKKHGIALKNVNSRIKMLFGSEFGMHVYSVPEIGTDVMVQLPLIAEGDYDEKTAAFF